MNFGLTDDEIRKRFGGEVVAIWNKQVWGSGSTYTDALNDAVAKINAKPSADNPPPDAFVFVPVPELAPQSLAYPEY
jgi:hypothetical protein